MTLRQEDIVLNAKNDQAAGATAARISKGKLKSPSREARNYKMTVIVPVSLAEDARLLALVKGQSVSDMVNRYLESEIAANREEVEAMRAIVPPKQRKV